MAKRSKSIPVSGPKLAFLRDGMGYTQEAFASEIGMTLGGIARIEGKSKTGMNKGNFLALAQFLKIDVTDLRARLGPDADGDVGSVKTGDK